MRAVCLCVLERERECVNVSSSFASTRPTTHSLSLFLSQVHFSFCSSLSPLVRLSTGRVHHTHGQGQAPVVGFTNYVPSITVATVSSLSLKKLLQCLESEKESIATTVVQFSGF